MADVEDPEDRPSRLTEKDPEGWSGPVITPATLWSCSCRVVWSKTYTFRSSGFSSVRLEVPSQTPSPLLYFLFHVYCLNWSQNYLGLLLNAICMGFRGFREVSDGVWEVVRPFLPPLSRVGRPRADDRMVLNGILYVLTTGCRWCDMPAEYGSYKTAWRRLQELVDGLSDRP
jgi:hypothetical protein